jgi:hypothetical protein
MMLIAAFIVETHLPVEDNICYSISVHSFHCVLLRLGDCHTTWKYLLYISHQPIIPTHSCDILIPESSTAVMESMEWI